jgi:hypothetical protein
VLELLKEDSQRQADFCIEDEAGSPNKNSIFARGTETSI